jgi:hypothetical protein
VAFFGSQATHFQQRIGHGGVWFTEASLRLPHDPILAKIDIDGAEYDIMDEIVMEAAGLTGLCIEVHDISQHLHVLEYWVGAMQARGLLLVHVHANNFTDGECVELTFARGSLVSRASQVQNLDQPNDPTKPEYRLVFDR